MDDGTLYYQDCTAVAELFIREVRRRRCHLFYTHARGVRGPGFEVVTHVETLAAESSAPHRESHTSRRLPEYHVI